MSKKYISYLFVLISLFLLSACSEREQAKKDYFALKAFNDGAGTISYKKARSIRLQIRSQMEAITKSGKQPTQDDFIKLNQLNQEAKDNLDVTVAELEKVSVKHPYGIELKRVMLRMFHHGYKANEVMDKFLLAYQKGDDISSFEVEIEKIQEGMADLESETKMIAEKLIKVINKD